MESDRFSIRSRLKSFRHAINGLYLLIKNEHNSRIHLVAAIAVIIAGFAFRINRYEWSVLLLAIGFVFFAEIINSAIESLADKLDTKWDELIRNAKDYSAAAVLTSGIIALILGCIIFIPKIF